MTVRLISFSAGHAVLSAVCNFHNSISLLRFREEMSEPLKQCCSPACKHPHAVKFFFCDCRSGPGRWKSFIVKSLQELFKHTHRVNMRILYSNFLQTGGRRVLFCFLAEPLEQVLPGRHEPPQLGLEDKGKCLILFLLWRQKKKITQTTKEQSWWEVKVFIFPSLGLGDG